MIGVEISDKYTPSKNKTGGEREILIIKKREELEKNTLTTDRKA